MCTPAIRILSEMGVMKELQDNNEAHFADNGGFVSPMGIAYIGNSKQKLVSSRAGCGRPDCHEHAASQAAALIAAVPCSAGGCARAGPGLLALPCFRLCCQRCCWRPVLTARVHAPIAPVHT